MIMHYLQNIQQAERNAEHQDGGEPHARLEVLRAAARLRPGRRRRFGGGGHGQRQPRGGALHVLRRGHRRPRVRLRRGRGGGGPHAGAVPSASVLGYYLNLPVLATAYRDNRTIIYIISGDTCPSGSMMADGVAEAATQNSIAQVMVTGGTRTFSISVGGITNAVYR